MSRPWFSRPLVWLGIAALVLLILALVLPGARAQTGELLNLFRMQQVQIISIDLTGLEQLTGDGVLGNHFIELISNAVDIRQEPREPVIAGSAEEASQLTGINVRVPIGVTPSQIRVTKAMAFSFKLDRTRAQALLDEAGRSDLILPASLDGVEVFVDIPTSASVAFGPCPQPGSEVSGNQEQSTIERLYPGCVILAQIPIPGVNAPASLPVEEVARAGLEYTGISSENVAALTGAVTWTSTLLIPIPTNPATYKQVNVDGVTGILIQGTSDETPQFVLLWVKEGIIYAIGGLGTNSQQAIEMANSLQ